MTQRYRKFKRSPGMWYAFDNVTGNSVSLKTQVKAEAEQKVNAMNGTERQPSISLGLAKLVKYLSAIELISLLADCDGLWTKRRKRSASSGAAKMRDEMV